MSDRVANDIWQEEYPDLYDYHMVAPFYRDLISRAATKFDTPSTIVDAGGGTGNLAQKLRENGHSVVVADMSRPMVANAKAKLGASDIEYVQADLDAGLPFAHQCVDGIAALNVVYLLDEPQQFLDEVRQVLPPGGTFVASGPTPDPDMGPLLRSVVGELIRTRSIRDIFGLLKVVRLQSRITEHVGDGTLHGLTEADWRERLTAAGFTIQEIAPIYEGQGYLVTAELTSDG